MFQKSIEAIIAEGVRGLEGLKREAAACATEAQLQVQRSQSEIQSLVNLAKQVPEKVFDRYSHVLVGTLEEHSASVPQGLYAYLRYGNTETQLRGLMGGETLKKGKYRVIVLVEPIQ